MKLGLNIFFAGALVLVVLQNAFAADETVSAGNMKAFCRGEASSKFGTKPMYVKTEDVSRSGGAYIVHGTVDLGAEGKKSFKCTFDEKNRFTKVE